MDDINYQQLKVADLNQILVSKIARVDEIATQVDLIKASLTKFDKKIKNKVTFDFLETKMSNIANSTKVDQIEQLL